MENPTIKCPICSSEEVLTTYDHHNIPKVKTFHCKDCWDKRKERVKFILDKWPVFKRTTKYNMVEYEKMKRLFSYFR